MLEQIEEFVAGNLAGAEVGEVFRRNLAIDEMKAVGFGEGDETGQGYLGGLGLVMEHGFSEEGSSKGDSVKASDEVAIAETLERVGVAFLVQLDIGLDHVGGDPTARLIFAWYSGARVHYLGKGGVYADLEGFFIDRCLQGSRKAEFIWKKEEARIWGMPVPEWRFSPEFPWENPV